MHPQIARAWSVWPGVTLLVLLAIMSAWAILRGVLEIAAAGSLRHVMPRAWLLAVSGAASVVFRALLLVQPAIALVTLVFLVAGAALASGTMATVLALHLRRLMLERGTPPHLVL